MENLVPMQRIQFVQMSLLKSSSNNKTQNVTLFQHPKTITWFRSISTYFILLFQKYLSVINCIKYRFAALNIKA